VFNWQQPSINSFSLLLRGDAIEDGQANAVGIVDDSFLLLFNGHFNPVDFKLPFSELPWEVILRSNTRKENRGVSPRPDAKESVLRLAGRSFVLLCKKRVETKPVETLPIESKHSPSKLRKRL